MPYEIETQDGIVIRNIPDDVPRDDASLKQRVTAARVQRDGAPATPRGASGAWTPDATPEQRLRASVPARAVQGVRDVLDSGAQMVTHALPAKLVDTVDNATAAANRVPVLGDIMVALGMTPGGGAKGVDQTITNNEREYQDARKATGQGGLDLARAGGNMAVTAPLVPGGAARTLLGRTAAGAATGAASGALQPVTENADNFVTEKAKQIGTGAAFGGVAAPITGGIARVIRPNTRPEVDLLMRENVTPTVGQIMGGAAQRMEEKARSLPIVGDAITAAHRSGVEDLNRAAYARALAPIGGTVPQEVGHAGVDDVHRQLSAAYDQLLPRLSFRADQQFATELGNVHAMASQLPPAQAQRFEQILREQVIGKLTPQGNASGATMKEIESQLGRMSRGYRSSPDFDARQLGDAVREVQSLMRQNLERMNPQNARELSAINRGYSELVRIENAAGRTGSAGGVFTPAGLEGAVRATDSSVRKNAVARGNAQMQDLSAAGRDVLAQKVPDSGTAGRLLLDLGATGGAAMLNPSLLAGAGVASLPYLPIIRRALAVGMTQRPQAATALANRVREIVGPAAALGAPALYEGARN